MIKLLQYSSVAIAVAIASPVYATDILIPNELKDSVSIYDFPGTYFDGGKVRAADENDIKITIPFQIKELQNLSADPIPFTKVLSAQVQYNPKMPRVKH